jgi:hypothetical protein
MVGGITCYPPESIPPMTPSFLETNSKELSSFDHDEGVQPYSVSLPAGTYVAYAYRKGSAPAGSYSAAITCGNGPDCTDYNLLEFEVNAGETITDIDVCDLIAQPGTVPTEARGPQIALPTNPTVPPGGVSRESGGTYQRVRVVDTGEGKQVVVDNWQDGAWVTSWTKSPQDPFPNQILDWAGWYQLQGCQKLVAVTIRRGNPLLFLTPSIYR